MTDTRPTSDCPFCRWRNIYWTTTDGSRELAFHKHMEANHPNETRPR